LGVPRDAGKQVLDRARARYGSTPPTLTFVHTQLAKAYATAGQDIKAEKLLRSGLELAREQFGAADLRTAAALSQLGTNLIHQAHWTEAETILRECLAIREKAQPDDWSTFNTRSQLGGILLGQGKFAEAEPLILAGYDGLGARATKIPAQGKSRLQEAAARVVNLYETWGRKDKANEWQKKLAEAKAPAKPEAKP
jgi:hypothetical protein